MSKIYLQGQLFLKKGPKPISKDLAESLKKITYILHGKECDVKEGQIDYSGVDCIYQLIIYNNKMFLRRRDSYDNWNKEYIPITEQELEKDYIDFMKYLKESTYIGKYGKRMKPALGNGDRSYMDKDILVLYHSDTHMVIYSDFIKEFYPNSTPIKILDSRYCNNWEFCEKAETLYNNPIELYKQIYKEPFIEEKNNRKKL